MNPLIDKYLMEGCYRCSLGGTSGCKVHNWEEELIQLRRILLDCGLTEELKWGVPCYTFQKKNILILAAFKGYCALSFFKGALLSDERNILIQVTENVQAVRHIRFMDVKTIIKNETLLKAYIFEAIEVEKTGKKPPLKKSTTLIFPLEFQHKLDTMPTLKIAFEALTPGRQKAYNLYFSAPKQAKTREARVEKCMPLILNGKGLND